jgi:excisionase family DNA binding protein
MTLIEILEDRKEALNVAQVAELLGISEKKVYHSVAAGLLPAFRVGKAIRFDPQNLADWLREKKPCGEQRSSNMTRKESAARSDRKGQTEGPFEQVLRGKVKSLETALALHNSVR